MSEIERDEEMELAARDEAEDNTADKVNQLYDSMSAHNYSHEEIIEYIIVKHRISNPERYLRRDYLYR